jgi:hypothetical protein
MLGCKNEKKTEKIDEQETVVFKQDLVDELERMCAIDKHIGKLKVKCF